MFSIGDDELDVDLDDEEFLLAACGIPPVSKNCTAASNLEGTSISSSKNNKSVENTSKPSRTPLNQLKNSLTPNNNKMSISSGDYNKRPQQIGSSSLNNNIDKSRQTFTFNLNSSLNINQGKNIEHGPPPSKKVALSSKDSFGNNSQGFSCGNISNFSQHRNVSNHDKHLNTLQKSLDKSTSNGGSHASTRHASSLSISYDQNRHNMTFAKSSTQSTAIFQTPNQNKKATKHFSPRDGEILSRSFSSDVDVTPSRKSARKFPGPAGLLPKLNAGQSLDELSVKLSPAPSTSRLSPNNLQRPVSPCQSQVPSEDEEFSRDPWIGMFNEYKQNVPALMRYTILQVISEAASQRLKYGKVPSLCVLVKTSSPTETDSSIFLKDPTGEIHGTLHKKVLEEYPSELGPGAGIILKQVSVFSPSPRKHYLNITPGNIIHIYPPDPSHVSSSQPLASQGTQPVNTSPQQRLSIQAEPEICLEKSSSDDVEVKESPPQESQNFNDLLEGLEDEDDILDSDLLDMY